jgi:hypothetical protein
MEEGVLIAAVSTGGMIVEKEDGRCGSVEVVVFKLAERGGATEGGVSSDWEGCVSGGCQDSRGWEEVAASK